MEGPVGRRVACPECGADLHACLNCRHYDESAAHACREPHAEHFADKETSNACDLFQLGDGASRRRGAAPGARDALAALFVVLGFYYAAQRHRPISDDARDTRGFVAAKKTLSLVLLAVFGVLAARSLIGTGREFFESFYTVLVFADILVVLVSLRYSSSYHVVFRNSGLAVATVLLRLALSAPVYWNAALGTAAALFALGLTLAGNRFAPVLRPVPEGEPGRAPPDGS